MASSNSNKLPLRCRFFGILQKLSCYIYAVYLIIAILLVLICPSVLDIKYLPALTSFNLLWLFLGIIFALLISFIYSAYYTHKEKIEHKKSVENDSKISKSKSLEKKYNRFTLIGIIIVFCLFIIKSVLRIYLVGWDVWLLHFYAPVSEDYFSHFPNNLFLKGINVVGANFIVDPIINIFSSIFPVLSGILHKLSNESWWYCICVFLNLIFSCLIILMISKIVFKLFTDKLAKLCFIVISAILLYLPWTQVPYSDMVSMFVITCIFYTYFVIKNPLLKVALISFFTVIGYFIKPTVIFITASIVFISICTYICVSCKKKYKQHIASSKKNKLKQLISSIVCIALNVSLAVCIVNIAKSTIPLNINPNLEFGPTHFINMGLNPETEGYWNQNDVDLSSASKTPNERAQKNLESLSNKLKEMGGLGLVELFAKKTVHNYGDGSFMWEVDGSPLFYKQIFKTTALGEWLNTNFKYAAQIVWFAILFACILSAFAIKKRTNEQFALQAVCCTTLILSSLFLTIFECGARYFLMQLPLFVCLFVIGISDITSMINKLKNKKEDYK